jgi:hypothetical protein
MGFLIYTDLSILAPDGAWGKACLTKGPFQKGANRVAAPYVVSPYTLKWLDLLKS